jgi:pyrroline-5-carboxylate reductase
VAFDSIASATDNLGKDVAVSKPETWLDAGKGLDAIIIAVKPADVPATLAPLAEKAKSQTSLLWCSIAAGVSIASLEKTLGAAAKICRVMPNTPALIGEAMSAFSLNKRCTVQDAEMTRKIFGACGSVAEVPEKLMNAVTGLSGSGPAYVYLFIEALIEGGVTAGLPYTVARESAIQTIIGAAKMVASTGENPAALKAKVTSPGGTTARGILALEQNNFKYAVMKAVMDAAKRSEELGS